MFIIAHDRKEQYMANVKEGDTIRIHYTGKFEDGTVFDSSEGREPLEFTVGEGKIIPGVEQGVIGMVLGESKSITVPLELGYGPYMKEMVFELGREKVPENFNPEIGRQVQMHRADGLPIVVTVIGIFENHFLIDCNHPLAGKTLIFETSLLEIL